MKSRKNVPILAVIGRPNVGKSTLFNRIIGRRKANVYNQPGLTRDRNYEISSWEDREFLLIDTGGYDTAEQDHITARIREQVLMSIDEADAIIFLTEVGLPDNIVDEEIMNILRRSGKPFILTVNKCDTPGRQSEAWTFTSMGVEEVYPVSAEHGLGIGEMLDAAVAEFPPSAREENEAEDEIRIAVVGRQNAGKSTLVNRILGEDRVIAGPLAGTTRDAVDSPFYFNGQKYLIIDTAGIRRRGKVQKGAEHLSVMSSIMSIHRSDVSILMIDGPQGITNQDAHVGGYIYEEKKAAIIAVNKWDECEKDAGTAGKYAKIIRREFNFLPFAPIIFMSALTGQRTNRLFQIIDEIMPQYRKKIDTSSLNDVLEDIIRKHPPPTSSGKQLKIKYVTQTGIQPPTFTLFVNNPTLMHFTYKRYLRNQFSENLGLDKTPVILKLRRKS